MDTPHIVTNLHTGERRIFATQRQAEKWLGEKARPISTVVESCIRDIYTIDDAESPSWRIEPADWARVFPCMRRDHGQIILQP